MRPIFTQLSNVAMETSAAIVLVGHMNKNEAAKDIHRGLGSVDISASVRSIIVVGVDKDDRSLRTVRSVKSNFDESDFNPIGFRLDAKRCVYFCGLDDNDAYFESHSPRMFEAVGLLREVLAAGPVEHSEIKAILKENGISERTANRAKKELEIISKKADGKTYWIMPKASKID